MGKAVIAMTVDQSSTKLHHREFDDESADDVIAEFEALRDRPDVVMTLSRTATGDELLAAIDAAKFFVGWVDSTGVYQLDRSDGDGESIVMRIGGQQTQIAARNAVADDEVRQAIRQFFAGARSSSLIWTHR